MAAQDTSYNSANERSGIASSLKSNLAAQASISLGQLISIRKSTIEPSIKESTKTNTKIRVNDSKQVIVTLVLINQSKKEGKIVFSLSGKKKFFLKQNVLSFRQNSNKVYVKTKEDALSIYVQEQNLLCGDIYFINTSRIEIVSMRNEELTLKIDELSYNIFPNVEHKIKELSKVKIIKSKKLWIIQNQNEELYQVLEVNKKHFIPSIRTLKWNNINIKIKYKSDYIEDQEN